MMRRRPLLWGLGGVLVAGAVAATAYLAGWLTPAKPVTTQPQFHAPQGRQAIPPPRAPFVDITEPAGVRFRHVNGMTGLKLLPETMGAGVAVFDFDADGRQDLLFVNSCPWPGHPGRPTPALYRNKGDGTFEDVTAGSGLDVSLYGMGVAVGDLDNDGYSDVFLSGVGGHRLFHNEGGKRFRDVTATAGLPAGALPQCSRAEFEGWKDPIPFGSSCTFVDYDGDGRLDLFVCHYVTWAPKIDMGISSTLRGGSRAFVQPREFDGAHCALFRNVDGQKFEDVSEAAGVRRSEPEGVGGWLRPVAKALGVVLCDPDNDGWPDLVVANDTVRNLFFRNVADSGGRRRFEEIGYDIGVAYAEGGLARGGMGIDWGEYRPGRHALVIANFANEPNTFLSLDHPKQLLFSDNALSIGLAGPSRAPLKFGAFFFDYDLDGRLDLLTCNGHIEPDIASIQASQSFAQPAQLFWNSGDPARLFEPVAEAQGGADLFKPLVGRGSAFGDLDGDGDLDVVLTANGGAPRVLRNDQALGHHWVRLNLQGDGRRSNRSAIGARVTVEAGGKTYQRQVTGGRGYLSQSELPLTVGLGDAKKVDRVTVRWPGRDAGPPEVWTGLEVNRTHDLRQGGGSRE